MIACDFYQSVKVNATLTLREILTTVSKVKELRWVEYLALGTNYYKHYNILTELLEGNVPYEQSCDIILKWMSYRLNEGVEAAFN